MAMRRSVSWGATLALLAAAALGVSRLPGAGRLPAELRWSFARDRVGPQVFHRAALLLRTVEQRTPGAGAQLARELLADGDGRVVRGVLTVLGDQLQDPTGVPGLREVFDAWWLARPTAERIALLPQSLVCRAASSSLAGATPLPARTPLHADRAPAAAVDDERLLVAATLQRDAQARELAEMLLFRHTSADASVAQRLRYLDNRSALKRADDLDAKTPISSISAADLQDQLRLDLAHVRAMLADPVAEVRWAAGRILAVSGEAAGVSAVCEWLRAAPRAVARADALLTDLLGCDWRNFCASRTTTRESSPRDGGG